MRRVSVLLPYPLAGALDYGAPEELEVEPGDLVSVPLGRRESLGVVWDCPPETNIAEEKLRPIIAKAPAPPLLTAHRRFIEWVADYTLNPVGSVLAMAMSGFRRPTPRQKPHQGFPSPDPGHPGPLLSAAQSEAAARLIEAEAGEFSVTLLDGVTGAGKTEVYLEAIAATLRRGRQALVLLPEIALSAQWLERFARRFGVLPAVWHSEVTPRLRRLTWGAAATGEVPVVVGARSALFVPFQSLGLIIVDEEHETAFKQEEGVIYHARDMAVVRARLAGVPAILVSATPSLETIVNAERGRYRRVTLSGRHGGARLPEIGIIDLRRTPPECRHFLSAPLIEALGATLEAGEQALLFLNRRGYAPLTLCRHCGHRLECPNCSAWLVEHRARGRIALDRNREAIPRTPRERVNAPGQTKESVLSQAEHARGFLQCHHCGYTRPLPPDCPACGARGSLTPVGPGVERITEEVAAVLPTARRLIMASDTLDRPNATEEAVRAITERSIDLIIGTQMVAKGWHFPHLTLVGVVDADLGLAGADLRAGERTFQLLHQVAGRAGRAEAPGRALIQTWCPEHPVMRALASGDAGAFIAAETAERRRGQWPPFGRLAALIVSAASARAADEAAAALGITAPSGAGIAVLGPAPAPLARLGGRYRRRLLLKTARNVAPQKLLRDWLTRAKLSRAGRVRVDIDPTSFL